MAPSCRTPVVTVTLMPALLPTFEPLTGPYLHLTPMTEADLPELATLLSDPRQHEAGMIMYTCPTTPEEALALARRRYFAPAGPLSGLGYGKLGYAIRLREDSDLGKAGTLVGTSTLSEFHLTNESTHVGTTMYGRSWWGTVVNPAAKLILLGHAFDDLGYGRVRIQTDVVNLRSRAAIEKLGARFEGVRRRDMLREDGTFRDTAAYAITLDDWPEVRRGLIERVNAWPS